MTKSPLLSRKTSVITSCEERAALEIPSSSEEVESSNEMLTSDISNLDLLK